MGSIRGISHTSAPSIRTALLACAVPDIQQTMLSRVVCASALPCDTCDTATLSEDGLIAKRLEIPYIRPRHWLHAGLTQNMSAGLLRLGMRPARWLSNATARCGGFRWMMP